MTPRMGYSIPLSKLSTSVVHLPGGLAANPKLHFDEAAGLLRVSFDRTARAVAAYDALPAAMRRTARDQGENMEPRGSTGPGGKLSDVVAFLKSKLSQQDWATLVKMTNGGETEPEDDVHRREGGDAESSYAQDFAARYPGAARIKTCW